MTERTKRQRVLRQVPVVTVGLIVAAGVWMTGRLANDDFDVFAEIGVGLVTGGAVGGALLLIDERRENERDAHDEKLADAQRRHLLAVAIVMSTDEELEDRNLSGQDLRGIVLADRNLEGVVLVGTDLAGANLEHATLNHNHLMKANLAGANLTGADLEMARLDGANLTGANLSEARMANACLAGADLTAADLSRVDLDGADLTGAVIAGAKFHEASISGVNLKQVEMDDSVLDGATWVQDREPQWPKDHPHYAPRSQLPKAYLTRKAKEIQTGWKTNNQPPSGEV